MTGSHTELPVSVTVVRHPVVQHLLTRLRERETPADEFRRIVEDLAALLFYESSRGVPLANVSIETPVESWVAPVLDAEFTLVPILRGGLVMLNGAVRVCPEAYVGHLGLYREQGTPEPVMYYNKLPPGISQTQVVLLEPMLSTGRSCCAAVEAVKQAGAAGITLITLIATPDGIGTVTGRHPDIRIVTAAVDRQTGSDGLIRPGLGDAAERMFRTG